MITYESMRRDAAKPLTSAEIIAIPLKWHLTGDPLYPYESEYNGLTLKVRLNSFPDKEMYTHMLDEEALMNVEDWPVVWKRPSRIVEAFDIAGGFIREFYRRTFHRNNHGSAIRNR